MIENTKKIELLSPVGDFECLQAAVQNGADSVYFGATSFSARASATNFSQADLKRAIIYAKTRGVNTHLTLNTLITNNEFNQALEIAAEAYSCGIDAIIVQDLGLAKVLHDKFPDLPLHGSTQMTIHNLDGALALEKLGFKRVVLSRELSIDEIEYISHNCNIEVEAFIHGALCISYSGQCLMSSMIGGRSGNRGKCAQPCRLNYDLIEQDSNNTTKKLDSGYLLSTRDLCGLDYIPEMINADVNCLKIEGRMKSPEYVATVTRIYRKYIDMYYNDDEYFVDESDKLELMQVFNRGSFSSGHLASSANRSLVFKEKPNNMGIYLGNVASINSSKNHILVNLDNSVAIGDTIQFEKENTKYRISELMINKKNKKQADSGKLVEIGRMKGNIHIGDKVYKLQSKELSDEAYSSYTNVENKKIPLSAHISIKKNSPIKITVNTIDNDIFISNDIEVCRTINVIPEEAKVHPITKDRILAQLSKTKNTIYNFENIDIELEDNLFIPSISSINELRRTCLDTITEIMEERISRKIDGKQPIANYNLSDDGITDYMTANCAITSCSTTHSSITKTEKDFAIPTFSLLLNTLNINYNYEILQGVNNIYIPLKYFMNKSYESVIAKICEKFSVYIFLPPITRLNASNILKGGLELALHKHKIYGLIFSNLSNNIMLEELKLKYPNLKFIANYTFNVYNSQTISTLQSFGYDKITISPELNENIYNSLSDNNIEMIIYGKVPVMYTSYCPLGCTNKCYPTCKAYCKNSDKKYYLKDRLGFNFRIIPDSLQTISTIYNSNALSFEPSISASSYRIDILDESIEEIQTILNNYTINHKRLEGKNYSTGNWCREI